MVFELGSIVFTILLQKIFGDEIIDFMALGNSPSRDKSEMPMWMASKKANANRSGWFRIGPYIILHPVCDNEMKLIRYRINEDLDIR